MITGTPGSPKNTVDLSPLEAATLITGLLALAQNIEANKAWDQTPITPNDIHLLAMKLRGTPPEVLAQLQAGVDAQRAVEAAINKVKHDNPTDPQR